MSGTRSRPSEACETFANIAQTVEALVLGECRLKGAVFVAATRGVQQANNLDADQRGALDRLHDPLQVDDEVPDVAIKTDKNGYGSCLIAVR